MKVVARDRSAFLVIDDEGIQHDVYAATRGGTRWVFCDGIVWTIETSRTRARAVAHENLAAPMPATVLSIPVKEGETVTRGQTVVLLEAMKMEMPLRASHDGTVSAIRCAVGDLVQPDVTLVEIE